MERGLYVEARAHFERGVQYLRAKYPFCLHVVQLMEVPDLQFSLNPQ